MSSSTRRRVTISSSTTSTSSRPVEVCTLYKDKDGIRHVCTFPFALTQQWAKQKQLVVCHFDEDGVVSVHLYFCSDRTDESTGYPKMFALTHTLHQKFCDEFNLVYEGLALFYPDSGCEYCGEVHTEHAGECQDWIDRQKKKRKASATSSSSSSSSSAKKAAVDQNKVAIFNTAFSFGGQVSERDPKQQSYTFNSKASSAGGVSRATFSFFDNSPVKSVPNKTSQASSAMEEIPITWRAGDSGASGMHWNVGDLILIRDGIYKIMSKNSIVFQRFSQYRARGVSIINTTIDGDDMITRAIPLDDLRILTVKGWNLEVCLDQPTGKGFLKFEKQK